MIKRIVTYFITFILLCYLLQWLVYTGLQKNKQGIYQKLNTVFYQKNNYTTLMLGSSRMFMHFDNNLFDSLTNSYSYNLGTAGATPKVSYTVLKGYLENSSLPNTIFLEFDPHIAHLISDTVFNFSAYFPYLKNKNLYHRFNEIDHRFFLFKYFPPMTLPYIGINGLSASANGWLGRQGPYDVYFKNGFFYNNVPDSKNNFTSKDNALSISLETRVYLDSCIYFCKQNQIQLIFTISPMLNQTIANFKAKSTVLNAFFNIAKSNNISVFNHLEDEDIINNPLYFEDEFHMLYPGARKYTLKLVDDFNNIKR